MLFDWIAQMFQTISPCTDDQIFDPIEYLYFIWTNKQTESNWNGGSHYVKRN